MSVPLSFIYELAPTNGSSLGDLLADTVTDCGKITTLLDCLCSTSKPVIHLPTSSRPPLRHDVLRSFVSNFALPHSPTRPPLGPNDRVMIVLPTSPENALALIALASYHTCAPVNASCTAAELKDDTQRLRAKAVLTTREAEERLELRTLQQEVGVEIIFVDERRCGPAGLFDLSIMTSAGAASIRDGTPQKPSKLHGLYDQSLVLHTSGTSGKKKVVPYTLRSLIVGTCAVVHSWNLREEDVNLNMMPLFHVGGVVRNLLAPIMSGGSTIMCPGFDPIAFWTISQELHATWYYAAPTIHHAILGSQPQHVVPARDLRIRMICNAAGGLLPSLAVQLRDTFGGAAILPSYGMTECMPITSPPQSYQLDRPGCSGIACGPYISIRDPFDRERELPRGQTGAVSVGGLPTFEGYEVSPDISVPLDTSAFSSEGWFDSGDMGYMDNDGYLFITGRSKEIINKGGEVISPFEVEEAIMSVATGYIKTTLAFAIEHDVLQECIGIAVVPVPDQARIGLTQLQDMLREHLHPSKWPFAIVYMDGLPKNSAGKPLRIKLSQRLGIGCLTDSVPAHLRHFEAETPDALASISDPIACRLVNLDAEAVHRALVGVTGVSDVLIRKRSDGSLEGFVSADDRPGLDTAYLQRRLARLLPGYCLPNPLYVMHQPFVRGEKGEVDFKAMEESIMLQNASDMSERALLVRDIVANLLVAEPGKIRGDSDFFLLGGNSLLLGKLSYHIRKQAGVNLGVASLFTNSTIKGIASLIEEQDAPMPQDVIHHEMYNHSQASRSTFEFKDEDNLIGAKNMSRGQTHPLSLIVQTIPLLFFYPLKAAFTWTILLFFLSYLTVYIDGSFWERTGALLAAIVVARLGSRIINPLTAILFKWIVIGRYKPGEHRMWSTYYLRWWIVNQSLRSAGRGLFALHPSLLVLYYRLLGARIGKDVHIDKKARLAEFDLLDLQDGCRIDTSVRGFCVERDGYFRLGKIVIGRRAVVNTFTQIAPGAVIADGTVYGPHSSSYEAPSPNSFVAYNRTTIPKPHWALQVFLGFPVIFIAIFVSYIPWFTCIWLMLGHTTILKQHLNALEAVIYWFASPQRVVWHALSRVVRAVVTPVLQLALGIIIKRTFGLNKEAAMSETGQWTHFRRWINSILLSQRRLEAAFDILGTHYEMTTVVFRAMGAKVGDRVYWPGSGVYCLDPELLVIGNDVVFGSRSELFTSDRLGSAKITIGDGAMIADRCVLLPGTSVGRRTVMGSGALGKRNAIYEDGSTWMGSQNGEAICFSKGAPDADPTRDTITPFGRAFYKRQASFFVFPYMMLLAINIIVAAISAAYWSISAVTAAQVLRQLHIHLPQLHLFVAHWYRIGIVYGLIASSFIIVLNIQTLLTLLWVIATKWIVIGRRVEGPCPWDKSSYCQRWQLHLTLTRFFQRGCGNGGVLGPLTGSAYIVWYFRALGAKIGKNCSIWAGGRAGLMTEPDLVELGNNVSLDECSVVAHINSRGNFALNALKISNGCALRTGSRLLSGASMEDSSMLCEHTLLTSGETAEAGTVYVGWPARPAESLNHYKSEYSEAFGHMSKATTATFCGDSRIGTPLGNRESWITYQEAQSSN